MKPISSNASTINPFKTHKSQTFDYTINSGSNPTQISVSIGDAPIVTVTGWQFDPATEPRNPNGNYTHTLYSSVKNCFYSSGSIHQLGNGTEFYPSSSVFVIGIDQDAFGERIVPGSFRITETATTSSLNDDGNGHLYFVNTSSYVGNIFYGIGVAVINRSLTSGSSGSFVSDGMYMVTGSNITIDFKSTHTIYEHQIVCTMNPLDFNYSSNPTAQTGSTATSESIYALMATGSLQPYMTTVGLYNDGQELLVVAKFPRAIKRTTEMDQTVIVKFDA